MAIEIIIDSAQQKTYAKSLIDQMPIDGSGTVITKKTDVSPTARQRRLWFKWCGEVAMSGLGKHDDKDDVHAGAKWKFVRPILLRDDEPVEVDCEMEDGYFTQIYNFFMKKISTSSNRSAHIREFTDRYISTEDLNKHQRAESLREFQLFWTGKGIELTDPSLYGLDKDLTRKPKGK